MALMETPPAEINWRAPDFSLQGVDGKTYDLENSRGENGLLVMFICNHCPFVKVVLDKIIRDVKELEKHGIKTIAIMSNDVTQYPEDSFEKMKDLSLYRDFPFPYVIDLDQNIARKYNAVCTPDFFGFDKDLKLKYRGRIDESGMKNIPNAKRELFEAMVEIAKTGEFDGKQFNSMGCNIKWAA